MPRSRTSTGMALITRVSSVLGRWAGYWAHTEASRTEGRSSTVRAISPDEVSLPNQLRRAGMRSPINERHDLQTPDRPVAGGGALTVLSLPRWEFYPRRPVHLKTTRDRRLGMRL